MRSYDSPGDVITFDIPEADWAKYPSADLNVQIGDYVGVTQGPVDKTEGKLNVCVERVFNRKVTNGAGAKANCKVYLKADGTLTTAEAGNVLFGKMIGAIAANVTIDTRVKLIG